MESLLQIVVLLAFVRFSCRATFFRSMWSVMIFALFVGVLSFLFYPFVIKQSGDFYATLLADKTLVGNVAVLITLEAVGGMLLSIGLLNTLFQKNTKSQLTKLKLLPELLIAGAILYAEQQAFYLFPGYKFIITTTITAVGFAGAVSILSLLMRWVLPEQGSRYEMNFLINLLLLLVAILLNAGLSDYNSANYQSEIKWLSAGAFIGIIVVFVALGFGFHLLKSKNKKLNKILKWI